MTKPIALQLYSVRDQLKVDLEGTVARVAELGFDGVEPFGLTPETAERTRRACDDHGLSVVSVHAAAPVGDDADTVLAIADALGCSRVVSGTSVSDCETLSGVMACCERFAEAHETLKSRGLRFGIHNHWWEYEVVAGVYPYRQLLDWLPSEVFFEVDVYWVQTAAIDPIAVLREMAGRARLLHVKDGPALVGEPMVPAGQGSLDIAGIVRANAAHSEALIVEFDACASPIWEAVAASRGYVASLR
ncbi:MAG TPA: sugar phosphate isomerase/epimerase [Trueperaceae bacterium]|nr:sugar phosphate isomerase/epimerase [Trueperaceae bacterium]